MCLTPHETVLALRKADDGAGTVLRMKLVRANPNAQIEGANPLAGKVNYCVGKDAKTWHANIPTYSKVRYRDVYPGIDLAYYGTDQHQLEYDFILAPNADPQAIGLRFEGAEQLALDSNGDLSVKLPGGGQVVHRAPTIYQERDGHRDSVEGRIVLRGKDTIGF